jgi:multimeric flavodoxin WrbA
MKIAVLHGQKHEGSTYHITQLFLDEFKDKNTQINEFYFTEQTSCIGCYNCFLKGENKCPHYEQNKEVIAALEQTDFIILESPCYCMGMTGQLKSFLDHLGYRWLSHRPYKAMFSKVGLCVSTAAGAGSKKVTKDLAQHMFFWGIPSIYRYSVNVAAMRWDDVNQEKKRKIQDNVMRLSAKMRYKIDHTHIPIKIKIMFFIMQLNQKNNEWNPIDRNHWESQGWLDDKRPWKK